MPKQFRLGLAVTIATTTSMSMTAIAQEVPEVEATQPPDQVIPDENSFQVAAAQAPSPSVVVETVPTVEFSQPRAEAHVAAIEASPPVEVSAPIAPPPVETSIAQPAAVSYQNTQPAEQSETTAQAVVVSTQPVTPEHSMPQTGSVARPTTPRLSPVSTVESRSTLEFAEPPKQTPVKVAAATIAQTQIPFEPPLNSPPASQANESQALQTQLQQLQQQQQQLQRQINQLQQQLVVPNQPAADPTPNNQGITVTGEALFWKPGTSDTMDYVISDPATSLATSGKVETVELDGATGARFGINYRLPNSGLDVGGKYTTFDTKGSSSAIAPTNGFLFSTQSHPFQNETAETANANATLDYKAGDFEAGYNIKAGKVADIRLFGGVRVGDVNRKMTANYNGADYTDGQVITENRFSGAGPRVGAEAKVNLGAGFSLFGRAAVSMQVGSLTSNLRETDRAGADVIADIERKQSGHVVPGLELAAGLGWETAIGKNAKVNVSGGYETQNLFNVTNNARFVDAASPGVFSQNNGDISLKGFFVRGGVTVEF